MYEKEMIELNNKIRDAELIIMDRSNSAERTKKSIKMRILAKCIELEELYKKNNDKTLSTVEKRQFVAEKEGTTPSDIRENDNYIYETELMKIELDYNKRLLQIYLSTNSKA